MGIKSFAAKWLARYVVGQQRKWQQNPAQVQEKLLQKILKKAANTAFGQDHSFSQIASHQAFTQAVPVRDYEELSAYFNRVKSGEENVLWPGKPIYLAKTSGTTSGTKYIPITSDSISNHINGARDALLNYIYHTGKSEFLDGKLIFLSGSPVLDEVGGIKTGRLSGIVNHHVPAYLRGNQMPSYETNCIEDWEAKLDAIIAETLHKHMTLISGIPPWVQMYFDRLAAKTGKAIKDIFPEFSLLVYGGVNFEPYRNKMMESIGKKVDTIETFPASEGFIAFQDEPCNEGLLLLLNSGIYYEFIPVSEYFSANPTRLNIGQVELNVNYALVMSSNAGLWAYSIGDTVRFVSLKPHRVVVSGRIKHFISAFGEHVIGEEVEQALKRTLAGFAGVNVTEFTVAPFVSESDEPSYHEWLIEFAQPPADIDAFAETLNRHMRELNSYYDDLQSGAILAPLRISSLPQSAFQQYMKQEGKLGGQNKVPRLSNTRNLADALLAIKAAAEK